MSVEREMTLTEYVGRLPEIHAARKELAALQAKVTELEAAARWIPIIRDLPVLGVPVDIWVRGKRLADWYLDHFSQTDHSLHWYSGMSNLFDGPESIPLADVDGWMPLPQPPSKESESDQPIKRSEG